MLSTRDSAWHWVAAFGLALAAAAPAGATARTARYTWAPATGPVAGYLLYVSLDGDPEAIYGYVYQPSAEIQVESGASLVVSVAAFDAAGRQGPRSDATPPLRLCPGDFDGDELIEATDVNRAQGCLLQAAVGTCAGADMNDDGFVASWDYLALDLGADACADFGPPGACGGDMDGDGWFTGQDFVDARICIGMYAEGNCALADFDGNGFVSHSDVAFTGRAIGTRACSN